MSSSALEVRLRSVKARCMTAGARIGELVGANKEAFKGGANLSALLLVHCQHLFDGWSFQLVKFSSSTRNIFKLICELAFKQILMLHNFLYALASSCVLIFATFSARLELLRASAKVIVALSMFKIQAALVGRRWTAEWRRVLVPKSTSPILLPGTGLMADGGKDLGISKISWSIRWVQWTLLRSISAPPSNLGPKCCRTPDSIPQAKVGLGLEFYVAFWMANRQGGA